MVGSRPLAAPNNHWLLHRQAGVGVGAVVGVGAWHRRLRNHLPVVFKCKHFRRFATKFLVKNFQFVGKRCFKLIFY